MDLLYKAHCSKQFHIIVDLFVFVRLRTRFPSVGSIWLVSSGCDTSMTACGLPNSNGFIWCDIRTWVEYSNYENWYDFRCRVSSWTDLIGCVWLMLCLLLAFDWICNFDALKSACSSIARMYLMNNCLNWIQICGKSLGIALTRMWCVGSFLTQGHWVFSIFVEIVILFLISLIGGYFLLFFILNIEPILSIFLK